MKTYELSISGYITVTVKARNSEEAFDKALEETDAALLYDYELQNIEEITEGDAN